tara:strand:+ start:3364 stop:4575 length:1212 start_codon:yes stop_codon:yes gene_type:complete
MGNYPSYASSSDLRDVYPNIDKYDSKAKLYSFSTDNSLYVHYDSGVVNNFFIDGKDQESGKQTIGTTASTAINNGSGYTASATSLVVDSGSALTDDTYIKIGNEIILITGISTNTLTVTRGHFGTNASAIVDDASIYQHFKHLVNGDWLYDSDNDFLITKQASDPSDNRCESGEDFGSHQTDILYKASRYLDSYIDGSLPRQAWKNDEGVYDYIIVRTTAQICAYFMLSAHDPENEDALKIKEEYETILDRINNGGIKLGYEKSADSSQGIIRELSASGTLKPVDLRGNYVGNIYDKIRLQITTSGVIGTATYSIWVSGNDKLGINQGSKVVTDEIITGNYQTISNGLQVRFGASTTIGTSGATANLMDASATIHDVYEIEAFAVGEEIQDSRGIKSAYMTRA